MSLVILFTIAAVLLFAAAFTLSSPNLRQFARQNFRHLLALSVLLVPMVTVLSACNNVSSL
jgi:hypothetical protein